MSSILRKGTMFPNTVSKYVLPLVVVFDQKRERVCVCICIHIYIDIAAFQGTTTRMHVHHVHSV